jgi:hypothetical protein
LVLILIPEEVWERVRLSWILFGIKKEQELFKMVVDDMLYKSNSVIKDGEEHPENYGAREIRMFRQETEKIRNQKKLKDFSETQKAEPKTQH